MYHPDGYMHSSHSASTSGQVPPMQYHPPNVGIPPYGYDSSMFHEKPIDGKLNFKNSQFFSKIMALNDVRRLLKYKRF